MPSARQQEYQRYLQSSRWWTTRDRRLAAAGYRCEYCQPLQLYRDDYIRGDRCAATTDLEVHHIHYNTLGAEADGDLEVLCRKHHLVRHLMETQCDNCGDQVFYHETDALAEVENAYASIDPSPHPMDIDTILDARSWGQEAGNGRWCDHCDYAFNKDD